MLFEDLTIEFLINALKDNLPGIEAHNRMMPKSRSLDQSNKINRPSIESAVLVLLLNYENIIHLCLIKRNPFLKVHPGEISFPGGKVETGETSNEYTALRETNEEIGVDINDILVIGKLTDIYIPVSNFVIHPVIGYYKGKPKFTINKSEVEEIIIIPFFEFLTPDNISMETILSKNTGIEVPCYKINNNIIWGATAMIISELCQIIVSHRMSKGSQT